MIISLSVINREIIVDRDYVQPSAGDVGTVQVSFDIQDKDFDGMRKRVTFACKGASVTVDYEDTLNVPHEVIRYGQFFVTLTGYDADNVEIARTHMMLRGIEVCKAGADEGSEPTERTLDVVSRIDALAGRLEQSEDSRQAAFDSSQAERDVVFAALSERAEASIDEVNKSKDAADKTIENILQRVEAGEFNGAPFRFSYQVGSVEELDGITGQQKFDLAIINSSVDDPDNSKFYMWTGTEWHYENDLSGGAGIQGPQGVQGVSLKNVRVVDNTKVEVTQYDPMTEQDRTYIIGDFAAPLSAGIQTYVDSKFQVVDAIPDNPVEGVIYMVRM